MKNLEPVEGVVTVYGTSVKEAVINDRLNTHKAVVELLEEMRKPLIKSIAYTKENAEATVHNQALTEAIQKVDELFKVKN